MIVDRKLGQKSNVFGPKERERFGPTFVQNDGKRNCQEVPEIKTNNLVFLFPSLTL